MEVVKRDGRTERVSFDKITKRIEQLCYGLDPRYIDPILVAQDTIKGIHDKIKTEDLDMLSAEITAQKIIDHPDFNSLAARLCISNLHKKTDTDFAKVATTLYFNKDVHGEHTPLISKKLYNIAQKHRDVINAKLDFSRDFLIDFFGFKTLERSYLKRLKGSGNGLQNNIVKIIERPQHLWMRVSLGIHQDDLEKAFETYDTMSKLYATHATPTLFNSGTPRPQMSSCYLMGMDDSISGIFDTIKDAAEISKHAGGIGIHVHNIRGKSSIIRGTNGVSNGIVPFLQVINQTTKAVNQGGKRPGSAAIYCEPWHSDIYDFIELRKPTGDENKRARDLFLALWIPDLFMRRVMEDGVWSLMCPDESPRLSETYGDEFEKLYEMYEKEGRFRRQVRAKDLWYHILEAQIETGMPYMCYKDNVNQKSNQKNIGVIRSSNLCSEIMEYSDDKEHAVCNLASICLPRFIKQDKTYDYKHLEQVAYMFTKNLNKVIDLNYYPTEKTRISNMKHRPIGLGVQGLADTFATMGMSYGSDEAYELNARIFETIYYGSVRATIDMAKEEGTYETFKGSPFSEGSLQFDLWGLDESELFMGFDWNSIKQDLMEYGARNSLLTTCMPTASTSQLMGNNESIEPFTSNLYTRSTSAGDFVVLNKHMVRDLIDVGLWNSQIKNEILYDKGSIQNINEIPEEIRKRYLTSYEMPQKWIVKQCVERGPFIDQSQSTNLFMDTPDFDRLTSSHFYGWKNGLKTGMYYLRGQAATSAISFGLDPTEEANIREKRSKLHEIIDDEQQNDSDENEDNKEQESQNTVQTVKACPLRRRGDPYAPCDMCSG
ncbi:MAG: ribonucleoside-diphosphate reductase subunit alpha [Magnetococcales bacterium]|nr:ribonucleoside-diphosphate reductase subunit alpha [Magnetococcales bacterium]|tara:strand:+ start:2393 stop:4876 length:2484 start_codon:yes stop_codon:yes gene_type:complete